MRTHCALIEQASAIVARPANRTFGKETLTETVRLGAPSAELMLARFPVTSVTSIVEDGTALSADDYELDAESGECSRGSMTTPCRPGPRRRSSSATRPATSCPMTCLRKSSRPPSVLKHLYFGTARDPAARAEVVDGAGSTTYSDSAVNGASRRSLLSDHRVPNIG